MKAATRLVEIQGVEIAVPVGSMDKPTAECERIMKAHHDPRGWKYPMQPFTISSKTLAEDYAYCLNWYLGGHEMTRDEMGNYVVTSKGYYHYVGA